jgi:hypothetical protein
MKIYPSVSQVLKPWQSPWVKEEDMIRGARRHCAYAAYLIGGWAPSVDPRDEGQFKSFCGWVDAHVLEVWFVEKKFTDECHGYSGTIDFGGILDFYPEGAILDWKPPSALTPVYMAQLAAYERLAKKHGFDVVQSGFLRPDPEGGVARVDWMQGREELAFSAFLSCLNCHRYFNQGKEA